MCPWPCHVVISVANPQDASLIPLTKYTPQKVLRTGLKEPSIEFCLYKKTLSRIDVWAAFNEVTCLAKT
eukprot:2135451-Amphidinium_carterae.1